MTGNVTASLRLSAAISGARVPAVLLTIVGAALVFGEPESASRWIGFFPDTGMFLSVFSFAVGGSLFALSGYSTTVHRIRRAPETGRGSRTAEQLLLFRAAGDLAWLWGGLLVVHLAAYARTSVTAGAMSTSGWSLSLLGFSSSLLCYALGMLLGALLGIPWLQFVVALAPYTLALLAGEIALSREYRLQYLIGPFVDQSWGPMATPNHGPIFVLAAYAITVAGTMAMVTARRCHRGPPRAPRPGEVVVLAAAVAAGAATALVVSPTTLYSLRSTGWACSEDGTVCGWTTPGSVGLDTLAAAYDQVQLVLDDSVRPQLRFAELNVPAGADYTAISLPVGHPGVSEVADVMVATTIEQMTSGCTEDGRLPARADLYHLLVPRLNGTESAGSPAGQIESILDAC